MCFLAKIFTTLLLLLALAMRRNVSCYYYFPNLENFKNLSSKQAVDNKNQVLTLKENGTFNDEIYYRDVAENFNIIVNSHELHTLNISRNNFMDTVEKIWRDISPLYFELHRYVGRKLEKEYSSTFDFSQGLIPANLLGTKSSDSWINLREIVTPYPEIKNASTETLPNEVFELVNDYVVSMGLYNITQHFGLSFNENETKYDCEVISNRLLHSTCNYLQSDEYDRPKTYASSHNIFFINYLQYFLITNTTWQWPHDWVSFEMLDDLVTILSLTPFHIKEVNGIENDENIEKEHVNYLMEIALEKIVYLSHVVTLLKWSQIIIENPQNKSIEEYDSKLWEFREKIQKISKPFRWSNNFTDGLDQRSLQKSDFMRYFVGTILEFQLYNRICTMEDSPMDSSLRSSDLYGSIEAGDMLREIIYSAATENWPKAFLNVTGDSKLDAEGLVNFFGPLYTFLKDQNGPLTEKELALLLQNEYEEQARYFYNKQAKAEWDFAIDLKNSTKEKIQLKTTLEVADFEEHYRQYYFQELADEDFQNESLKRQIDFLTVIGSSVLAPSKLSQLTNLTNTMMNIYSTARICPFQNQRCNLDTHGLSLEPDIEGVMASSSNHEELLYLWDAWRNATGVKMKHIYPLYVSLSNEAAIQNGFRDMGDMWVSDFECDNFEEEIESLWKKVKPLYDELHFYVSNKLKDYYGDVANFSDNLIPAHLLGNMWGQTWINIRNFVRPFPEAAQVDVTSSLINQNYTVLKMFQTADDFYKSLGLKSASMSYDTNVTYVEKPKDKEIECHGSAWDFFDKKDFRIKMCTNVNYEDFVTIHHEMGHIQYYMLYKDQPVSFRNGANPGFHEAIGDIITLSVITPQHLEKIGLLQGHKDSYKSSINSLMDLALEKIAFLPFGYLIDKWRWDIFKGQVPPEAWNSHWWYYRTTVQKLRPPMERNDEVHFDPGAKFHVPNDYQYISYFVAHILQFQFYRSFCILADQYDPRKTPSLLHKCDIYNSTKVGDKMRAGLSLGASKPWKEVLETMTGESEYDPSALMEYFSPLYDYLVQENNRIANKSTTVINAISKYLLLLLFCLVNAIN